MKITKYITAAICVLLIVGTLPSIALIIGGLAAGKVDDTNYFVGKLIIYLVIVAALATVSWKLIRSARNNGREDERNGVEHE